MIPSAQARGVQGDGGGGACPGGGGHGGSSVMDLTRHTSPGDRDVETNRDVAEDALTDGWRGAGRRRRTPGRTAGRWKRSHFNPDSPPTSRTCPSGVEKPPKKTRMCQRKEAAEEKDTRSPPRDAQEGRGVLFL